MQTDYYHTAIVLGLQPYIRPTLPLCLELWQEPSKMSRNVCALLVRHTPKPSCHVTKMIDDQEDNYDKKALMQHVAQRT